MIMLQSPSLVINSCDAPWPRYRMWETVNGDEGMMPDAVVREIIRVNRLALEHERSPLANVVINCHGADNGGGALYTGGVDYPSARINVSRVNEFSLLKKRNIGTIWLVACQAAADNLGKQLCQALAVACGSQVVAGDEDQDTGIWGGFRIVQGGGRGQIDEFEGTVYSFLPNGTMREIDPHEDIFTIME
jgi:hypothetical protein